MKVLAVDTATEFMSLAVADGRRVWSSRARVQAQDEKLYPAFEKLLKRAGLKLEDLDGFVAASGPGRFTGIRVGLTFVSILSGVRGKPAAAVGRLDAAAWRAAASGEEGLVAAVFPAAREELYFRFFRCAGGASEPAGPPAWTDPAGWPEAFRAASGRREAVLVGPAAAAAAKLLGRSRVRVADAADVQARDLIAPGVDRLACGSPGELEPLYLKPAYYERASGKP